MKIVYSTLLLSLAVTAANALTYGDACGHPVDAFCDNTLGLICGPDFNCTCSNGVVSDGLEYNLAWDTAQGKCLAQPNSPCIGTVEYPAPDGQNSSAVCTTGYTCVQEEGFPLGVGICKTRVAIEYLDHGAPCSMNTFCNKTAGLICTEALTCGCSHGNITDTLIYYLEWDAGIGKCVGVNGSACNTVATTAECLSDLTCQQDVNLPPTVGICTGDIAPLPPSSAISIKFSILILAISAFTTAAVLH